MIAMAMAKNVTGCGFGIGQADIDVEINGRNFCITLKLTDLDSEEDNHE